MLTLIAAASSLWVQPASAQQRFKAGLIAGLNASQIDGDRSAGYHKLGLMGGLRAAAILTDKTELSIELLYAQRGSQSELFPGNNFVPFKIKINYIEVPVMYNYADWLEEEEDEEYYKILFGVGLSYGRLINTEIEDDALNSPLVRLSDSFSKNDLSFTIGATFFATHKLGVSARWTRSLNLLFDNSKSSINAQSMRGKFLTFHFLYML